MVVDEREQRDDSEMALGDELTPRGEACAFEVPADSVGDDGYAGDGLPRSSSGAGLSGSSDPADGASGAGDGDVGDGGEGPGFVEPTVTKILGRRAGVPTQEEKTSPIRVVLVGAGKRCRAYASYALKYPEELQIVGVVDPDLQTRELVRERYQIPEEHCFKDVSELVAGPKIADAVFNGTMDRYHVPTTLPLLKSGYDVLLEKPAALTPEGLLQLEEAAHRYGRTIMVCHILRYSEFYRAIKERILDGVIGDVLHLHLEENVSAAHIAVSYVRGDWGNRQRCGAGMLLAKSSHDVDLLIWLKGSSPETVSSVASGKLFDPRRKPEGAGTHCLLDCPFVDDCIYSAKAQYLGVQHRWCKYVWDIHHADLSMPEREKFLRNESPYGRCVWDCDYDNVSQQSLLLDFGDGVTGSFNMLGGTARSCRTVHIVGTRGEIVGTLEDLSFEVRLIDPREPHGYRSEHVGIGGEVLCPGCEITSCEGAFAGQGGGDYALVEDFLRILRGEAPSISATTLDSSIASHLTIFAAEEAERTKATLSMCEYSDKFRR